MAGDVSDPAFRRRRAKLGAHAMHATHDGVAVTAKARAHGPGSLDYWRAKVDPDGLLADRERDRRARHAKVAYFTRLSMRAAEAKARKR
jgi:hypothetical protein